MYFDQVSAWPSSSGKGGPGRGRRVIADGMVKKNHQRPTQKMETWIEVVEDLDAITIPIHIIWRSTPEE